MSPFNLDVSTDVELRAYNLLGSSALAPEELCLANFQTIRSVGWPCEACRIASVHALHPILLLSPQGYLLPAPALCSNHHSGWLSAQSHTLPLEADRQSRGTRASRRTLGFST